MLIRRFKVRNKLPQCVTKPAVAGDHVYNFSASGVGSRGVNLALVGSGKITPFGLYNDASNYAGYLGAAAGTQFDPGTGDFTLVCVFNLIAVPGNGINSYIVASDAGFNSTNHWWIFARGDGAGNFAVRGMTALSTGYNHKAGETITVVYQRVSGVGTMHIKGTRSHEIVTAADTSNYYNRTGNPITFLGPTNTGGGYSRLSGYVNAFDFSFGKRFDGKSLAINPWQIFARQCRTLFIPDGAGGTLNASASGSDTASGLADIAAQVALAAVAVSTAGASAQPSVSVPLSEAGIAVSGGGAYASATVILSATGLAQAAAQAGLSSSVLLAAAAVAAAAGNAPLAVLLNEQATGAAQAGGSANLTGSAPGEMSANGHEVAAGQAALSVAVQLQAAGAGQAGGVAAGQAGTAGDLAGIGQANAVGWAQQSILINLTAAGFVHAMAQNALYIEVPLGSHGVANAGGQAQLGAAGPVRGARLEAGAPHLVTQAVAVAFAATSFEHGAEHV
jgi:hypothetical protein